MVKLLTNLNYIVGFNDWKCLFRWRRMPHDLENKCLNWCLILFSDQVLTNTEYQCHVSCFTSFNNFTNVSIYLGFKISVIVLKTVEKPNKLNLHLNLLQKNRRWVQTSTSGHRWGPIHFVQKVMCTQPLSVQRLRQMQTMVSITSLGSGLVNYT